MRAELRAALITLALGVYGVAASPLPKSVRASDLENPVARDELQRWSRIFKGLGVEATPEDLKGRTLEVGQAAADLRASILTPFRPWFRVTGTGQGWGLFAYPDNHPYRLVVRGRVSGRAWRILYQGLDSDHQWMGAQLRFRRIRGVYDGSVHRSQPGEVYDRFVDWVAAEALRAQPELDEVQIYMEQLHTTLPGAEPDPSARRARRRFVRSTTRGER